jgi:uncharacterized protein
MTARMVFDKIVPGKAGLAIEMTKGQILRITDLEGKQVVDMGVFDRANPRNKLSTSYSRTRKQPQPGQKYRPGDKLVVGDLLRSTTCDPLMTIVKETAEPKGIHDTYVRMCNRLFYEWYQGGSRDGCFETISRVVAPYAIMPEDVPDPLNVFMNNQFEEGRWTIKEPVTKPGDHIEFRAERDLIVAFSVCPEEQSPCNGYKSTPVRIEVFDS